MGKKQSLSKEQRAQTVTLSNLKFYLRQIAKKIKASKTAVQKAIMKYRNESFVIDEKVSVSMSMSQVVYLLAKFRCFFFIV